MKKILLLFIVGSVFAQGTDNSLFDKMVLIDGTIIEGEYISMNEKNIIFKPEGYPVGQPVEKSKVKLVKLSDGTIVHRFIIETPPSFIELHKNKIAGGLISLGSGLLIYNTNREPSVDIDFDFGEYADSLRRISTIGYLLIALGGIVLAVWLQFSTNPL